MPRPSTLVLLAVVLAAIVAAVLLRRPPPSRTPSDPALPATAPPTGTAAPSPGPVETEPSPPALPKPTPAGPEPLPLPAASTTAKAGYIAFPDQTWYPPLNGVTTAPPILFHPQAPFARVVGMLRDAAGRDWYVHENGTRSTTILSPDGTALGLVGKDTPALPTLPGEGSGR